MRILVDHPLPASVRTEVGDPNVLYRPALASVGRHELGRELARLRPDVLLTRRPLGGTAAATWRTACSQQQLVVVMIGKTDAVSFQGLPGGIVGCFVAPGKDSLDRALAVAENAWVDAMVETRPVATRIPARIAGGRSVAMVGAGTVNLISALRLVREGYEVTVYEKAPDPRADARWQDYGCSRGGGDARMFTLTEADGYYFGPSHGASDPFRTSIHAGGWRATSSAVSEQDLGWVAANAAVPRWLSRSYTNDIMSFNRVAGELWQDLMRDEPAAFDSVGMRRGILRLYTDEQHLRTQVARQQQIGADPLVLDPTHVAARHPGLADAVGGGSVAGGLEVPGFTVQAHAFLARLVDLLERSGVRFCWGKQVSQLRRDRSGTPTGLCVAGELVVADHLVISTGVYGGQLLRGTASDGLIHGVLGVWLTLPNLHPGLEHSLKIGQRGHLAEDANVTVATGSGGAAQLIIGSGYGWTGSDPSNIDTEELGVLYDAVEETARRFFPRAFAEAQESGLLRASRRFCVRPWTASSLGVLEMAEKSDGGVMVITGGHNTGGFAQAPVVAEAVAAALQGKDHLMHARYHPDRLGAFLHARRTDDEDTQECSPQVSACLPPPRPRPAGRDRGAGSHGPRIRRGWPGPSGNLSGCAARESGLHREPGC